tara:strand:- start:1584 stop:2762 length:1179 start_codon:yes stop_codon:yes gene_type:complete
MINIFIYLSGFFPILASLIVAEILVSKYDLETYGLLTFSIAFNKIFSCLASIPIHENSIKTFRTTNIGSYQIELSNTFGLIILPFIAGFFYIEDKYLLLGICILSVFSFYTSCFEELVTASSHKLIFAFHKFISFLALIICCAYLIFYRPSNPIFFIIMSIVIEMGFFIIFVFYKLRTKLFFSFDINNLLMIMKDKQGKLHYLNKLGKVSTQNIDNFILGNLSSLDILAQYELLKKICAPINMLTNSIYFVFNRTLIEDRKLHMIRLKKIILLVTLMVTSVAFLYSLFIVQVSNFLMLNIVEILNKNFELFFVLLSAFTLRAFLWWPRYISVYIDAKHSVLTSFFTSLIIVAGFFAVSDLNKLDFYVYIYFSAYLISYGFWQSKLYFGNFNR